MAGTQQPSHRPPRTSTKRRAQHRALRAPRGQQEHRVPGEGAPRGGACSPHSHSEGPGLLGGGAHRRAGVGAVAGTALRQQLRVHSSCQPCQAMQAHDARLSPRHQPATRLQVGAEAHLEEGGCQEGPTPWRWHRELGWGGRGAVSPCAGLPAAGGQGSALPSPPVCACGAWAHGWGSS